MKTIISLIMVAVCAISVSVANARRSVLSLGVERFTIENADMDQALHILRSSNTTLIVIGFEKSARHPDEKSAVMSVSLTHTTVKQILDALCERDPEYGYEIIEDKLIHVYPKNRGADPPGLLDIQISRFFVEDKMSVGSVIGQLKGYAHELGSYLDEKRAEYDAAHGIRPGGSAGSTLRGNMDPNIRIDLRDRTVREVLNGIALYSMKLNEESKPDEHGNKLPPIGWMYEFVIDPSANTGLGGIPHWTSF